MAFQGTGGSLGQHGGLLGLPHPQAEWLIDDFQVKSNHKGLIP